MDTNIVDLLLGFTLLGAEWVLWLLIALSILSIAVMIERFLFYMKIRYNHKKFNESLISFLDKKKWDDAKELCEKSNSLEAAVVLAGINGENSDSKSRESRMETVAIMMKQQLERGLVILGTLGNNAPFIGLFGTVIGIIKAFNDLSENPEGGPSVVMAGISEALVATAVGLLVAIPAVIVFNLCNRIVKRHVGNFESLIRTVRSYW